MKSTVEWARLDIVYDYRLSHGDEIRYERASGKTSAEVALNKRIALAYGS